MTLASSMTWFGISVDIKRSRRPIHPYSRVGTMDPRQVGEILWTETPKLHVTRPEKSNRSMYLHIHTSGEGQIQVLRWQNRSGWSGKQMARLVFLERGNWSLPSFSRGKKDLDVFANNWKARHVSNTFMNSTRVVVINWRAMGVHSDDNVVEYRREWCKG
jgi:hypothetical protein